MDLFDLKRQIKEAVELSAIAMAKQLFPAMDEVKYKEAIEIAGSKRWLDFHIKRGHIKRYRRGTAKNSPIYYSRLDIAATKKAEEEMKFYNETHQ